MEPYRTRFHVGKLEKVTKTILCLKRVGKGNVLVTTFIVNGGVNSYDARDVKTVIEMAIREFQFVRISSLLSVENYMLQLGNNSIDKKLTK